MDDITGEKKAVRHVSPGEAAAQLKSGVTNVATLPKGVLKVMESLKNGQAKKGK